MNKHKFPYEWTLKDADFTKDKGKVFSCFACGGGSTMGYKLAGFDVIGCNEIDPRMNKVYVANHHPRYNYCEDIRTFKLRKNLPEELYHLDILDGSPPCFVEGAMVYTDKGYKPIESVQLGDMVLTHKNRFRKVTKLYEHDTDELYEIKVTGAPSIRVTPNHPFYVRHMDRHNKQGKRTFGEAHWRCVKNLNIVRAATHGINEQPYLAFPVNDISKIPSWDGIETNYPMPYGGVTHRVYKSLDLTSAPLWKFIGRWVGDGWFRHSRKEVILCCGKQDLHIVQDLIQKAGLHSTKSEMRTSFRFSISNIELYLFMQRFGSGAENKVVPEEVISLPNDLLSSFLEGYLSADGHYSERDSKWICSSVSQSLILSIEKIVAKLYHQPCTFMVRTQNTSEIEGRKVNTKVSYSLSFFTEQRRFSHSFFEDGYIWIPLRKISKLQSVTVRVYNLEVEEDESYTVYNLACHNCSSFSAAGERDNGWGKEKKFKEGQVAQTLDTLFFDFIDLAKELQPKIVIAENVRGITLGDAKKYVKAIYYQFERAGYYLQHFLLNGANMGLPQFRQRVFFIAIRHDLAKPFLRQTGLFEQEPRIKMDFNEEPIYVRDIADYEGRPIPQGMLDYYRFRTTDDRSIGSIAMRTKGKLTMFNNLLVQENMICPTLAAREDCLIHYEKPLYFSRTEAMKISSFPLDYDFLDQNVHYMCGMSVPPIMMANVASNVYNQWLSKL